MATEKLIGYGLVVLVALALALLGVWLMRWRREERRLRRGMGRKLEIDLLTRD